MAKPKTPSEGEFLFVAYQGLLTGIAIGFVLGIAALYFFLDHRGLIAWH